MCVSGEEWKGLERKKIGARLGGVSHACEANFNIPRGPRWPKHGACNPQVSCLPVAALLLRERRCLVLGAARDSTGMGICGPRAFQVLCVHTRQFRCVRAGVGLWAFAGLLILSCPTNVQRWVARERNRRGDGGSDTATGAGMVAATGAAGGSNRCRDNRGDGRMVSAP